MSFLSNSALFFLIIAFMRYAICSLLQSTNAFNISLTITEGADALPYFILLVVTAASSLLIRGASPSIGLPLFIHERAKKFRLS